MADEFEIVKRSEVPERGTGGVPTEVARALEKGETVFVPGWAAPDINRLRNKDSYLARRGFMVHQRIAIRDGKSGAFVWAEKRDAPKA